MRQQHWKEWKQAKSDEYNATTSSKLHYKHTSIDIVAQDVAPMS